MLQQEKFGRTILLRFREELEKNQESQRAPHRRMEAARLNIFDPEQNVLDENGDHGVQ